MAVVISLSFWWIYLFVSVLPPAEGEAEQKIITAKTGQDVILPCRAPNSNIKVVEWSRPDLEPEYVLLYRGKTSDPSLQHPSFKNRVDLEDRQMKDGDVSLILKNVTTADNATTYECRIFHRGTNRRKRANLDGAPISIIYLSVDPPGPTGGDSRGHLGTIIPPSFICVAAILITVKKKKKKNSSLTLPSDKESEQMQV